MPRFKVSFKEFEIGQNGVAAVFNFRDNTSKIEKLVRSIVPLNSSEYAILAISKATGIDPCLDIASETQYHTIAGTMTARLNRQTDKIEVKSGKPTKPSDGKDAAGPKPNTGKVASKSKRKGNKKSS